VLAVPTAPVAGGRGVPIVPRVRAVGHRGARGGRFGARDGAVVLRAGVHRRRPDAEGEQEERRERGGEGTVREGAMHGDRGQVYSCIT
jgi:hypothetical protein